MATWTELSKYKHHAVRSDGAKFLDGVRNDSLNTSWLTVDSSGRVTLGPGFYDELLVVKGEVSDEQIKAWASMEAPFYDPTPVIPDEQIPSAQEWNSKARTYYQPTPPVATAVGDLWVDTDDNDRLYRWDGATWVDITDKSPIDAEKKPVYVKGAGADIDIDKYGIRAIRKADGKKTFEIDAETGDAYFRGDITGASGTFSGNLSAENVMAAIVEAGGITADHMAANTLHVFDKVPGTAAGGKVTINSSGVTITDGKLIVKNPAGITIIDGTSNMLKVHQTGVAYPNEEGTVVISFPDLGYKPAFLFYLVNPDGDTIFPYYFADTAVVSTNPPIIRAYHYGAVGIISRTSLTLQSAWRNTPFRYYIFKEEAI